jgi:hypothetical protein
MEVSGKRSAAETRLVDGRDANAYVSIRAPLPNWARVLARVSLSLTEYPFVDRRPHLSWLSLRSHSPSPASFARDISAWVPSGSGRRVARSRVRSTSLDRSCAPAARERMCAHYAVFADAYGCSPGDGLIRDADALRSPHLAMPYATRLSRRAATIIDTLAHVLYGGAWVYIPTRTLTGLTLERRG